MGRMAESHGSACVATASAPQTFHKGMCRESSDAGTVCCGPSAHSSNSGMTEAATVDGPISPASPRPQGCVDEAHHSFQHDEGRRWMLGKQYPVVADSIYFMSLRDVGKLEQLVMWQRQTGLESDRIFFSIDSILVYYPFCLDFGPLSIGACYRFREIMQEKLKQQAIDGKKIVLYTTADPRVRTNAACLLASWLVLELDWSPERAWAPLEFCDRCPFVPYRDASFEPVTFGLRVQDVLAGLHRAKECGILSLAEFDMDWYEYCDHPANADLHMIVPGVFAAFKGPRSVARLRSNCDNMTTIVDHTPEDYVELFKRLDVNEVVRLNTKQYDEGVFERAGLRHHTLYFDDCSTPNEDVLTRWFKICRERKGTLAVHCKAGLGRTGTLICCWLMRKYKFTGREAIGYIRVMRPGSVLGLQQEFLEQNEQLMWAMGDPDKYGEELMWGESVQAHNRGPRADDIEEEDRESARRRRAAENTEAMIRRAVGRSVPCETQVGRNGPFDSHQECDASVASSQSTVGAAGENWSKHSVPSLSRAESSTSSMTRTSSVWSVGNTEDAHESAEAPRGAVDNPEAPTAKGGAAVWKFLTGMKLMRKSSVAKSGPIS